MTTGSTIATLQYDGLGRRVVKKVENSADFDGEFRYYYDGQRLIEERRQYDADDFRVVKQYAWGTQYVDELLWVGVNLAADNSPANGGSCGRWFWAMHDVNYNVSGLAETGSGAMVERYEYTPYGERTVYSRGFLLADLDQDGDVDEDDCDLMDWGISYNIDRFDLNGDGDIDAEDAAVVDAAVGQKLAEDAWVHHPRVNSTRGKNHQDGPVLDVGLCDVGHQGLFFDKEFGVYYNRGRMYNPRLMRFMQRDPMGYVDGGSLYLALRGNPLRWFDAEGLATKPSFDEWLMVSYRESVSDLSQEKYNDRYSEYAGVLDSLPELPEPGPSSLEAHRAVMKADELRIIVYTKDNSWLSWFWKEKASGYRQYYPKNGRACEIIPAHSLDEAARRVESSLEVYDPASVQIEIWGHGDVGTAWIGRDTVGLSGFMKGSELYGSLARIRDALPKGDKNLIYFRTCDAFGDAEGKEFAKVAAGFFKARVAGHDGSIGLAQPGYHELSPREEPEWADSAGDRVQRHEKRDKQVKEKGAKEDVFIDEIWRIWRLLSGE